MDIDKIKRQAKQILDNFADALAGVEKEAKKEAKKEVSMEREEFEREEGDSKECDVDFRSNFLKNASRHDDDFIIAERGGWK